MEETDGVTVSFLHPYEGLKRLSPLGQEGRKNVGWAQIIVAMQSYRRHWTGQDRCLLLLWSPQAGLYIFLRWSAHIQQQASTQTPLVPESRTSPLHLLTAALRFGEDLELWTWQTQGLALPLLAAFLLADSLFLSLKGCWNQWEQSWTNREVIKSAWLLFWGPWTLSKNPHWPCCGGASQ